MPNFRLILEYEGSDFAGWQIQAQGARTVQGCLAAAIEQVTGIKAVPTGSGRTDAGVHAEAQVASVALETELSAERLRRALNGVLPRDMAVVRADVVEQDFDALRCAASKHYRYQIWNGDHRSPLRASRFHHVAQRLDLESMRKASQALVGQHDFTSFRAAGSDAKTSVRTLARVDVCGEPGGEVWVEVSGSGFLRYMVRNIVGTLLEVGLGRREAASVAETLAARDRSQAGPTAPARGLSLVSVDYAED